ncbi:glycosyltransferase family 2 protein [Xenorhabdus japonica]|uniref:Glycosyltransferase involved in cell wall bisynthesis n=1 Tax=Xenorhabdus japonica TaxID=53341 RepID=A0A1I5E6S5_9GAMM|nr:glycosyltransferase [Xenorhabdus japonica]SFO07033.1 Glycosyltransferase involved in cell wall bisynthesis [Xenorhabdus japonica]
MEDEKFSVVIPYYNKGDKLIRALNSLDYLYINKVYVVNDKSPIPIPNNKYNKKVQFIELVENKGPSYCRNLGASLVESDYILFLDADDYFRPALFNDLHNIISNINPPVISWGIEKVQKFDELSLDEKDSSNIAYKLEGLFFFQRAKLNKFLGMTSSSFCIQKKVFEELNGFDNNLRLQEDPEFFCRVCEKYNVCFINKIYSYYDISDQCSLSQANFNNIMYPTYLKRIRFTKEQLLIKFYKAEFTKYYLMALMNKKNKNYRVFLKENSLRLFSFKWKLLFVILSKVPESMYKAVYRFYRYAKY